MKLVLSIVFLAVFIVGCNDNSNITKVSQPGLPLQGTWKLISGTLIEKADTTITMYTKDVSFIKIINDGHFAFLSHDLKKGKDSAASFSAGGGAYSLKDSLYTEHLEYCNDRQWEGNDFSFSITINNDTLVQKGIEKIESAGINRLNIEKYVRLTKPM